LNSFIESLNEMGRKSKLSNPNTTTLVLHLKKNDEPTGEFFLIKFDIF